jgi:hypothetical protein
MSIYEHTTFEPPKIDWALGPLPKLARAPSHVGGAA